MDKKLIKIDRNGTKYWSLGNKCDKCGGNGVIWYYSHVDGGVCFDCGGSGEGKERIEKEYTPEYAAKLKEKADKVQAKRDAELAATAEKHNIEFLEKQGFNQDGKTYAVLGNTYSIKDEIKAAGGKWSNLIGWHFSSNPENYKTVEISVDNVYYKDHVGRYDWKQWKSADEETYTNKIKGATKAAEPSKGYFGNVGDKVELNVTFVRMFTLENKFGYGYWNNDCTYIYKFQTEDGKTLIWKTALSMPDIKDGQVVRLKGTIKEHSEYKNVEQTIMTRCKVSEV